MTSTVSDRHPISPRTIRRGLNYIAGLIGIGLTYFVLAKIGLALALIHPSASPIWPPTGFALGDRAVGISSLASNIPRRDDGQCYHQRLNEHRDFDCNRQLA